MSCWHVARTSSTGHVHARKVQNQSPATYTDFSVDSILSNDKKVVYAPDETSKSSNDGEEKMPTFPVANAAAAAAKISKRRRKLSRNPRVPFTSLQLAILESHYKTNAYISGLDVTYLSIYLNLSPDKIKVWFQNRRARERRQKKASINNIPLCPPSFIVSNNSTLSSFVKSSVYSASDLR